MEQGHCYPYNPRPSSPSPVASLYPRIGQPGDPVTIPPFAASGPPYNCTPSSAGTQIRVAIRNEYRISLPPRLETSVGDVQHCNFDFDYDLEKKILAEAENENPKWSQFVRENMASIPVGSVNSVIRAEPPPPSHNSIEERFRNSMAALRFESKDEESVSRKSPEIRRALYTFIADGENELDLTAGEEVEIEYEVDGWFYVKKKRPGKDGKTQGLVPVLYIGT